MPNLLLGICGGIAAYKTPELARQLSRTGFDVTPVLSANAKHFVTPTALAAACSGRVRDSLWDAEAEQHMGHIELARWADHLLIAPATANTIAKLAHGIADDLLSTLYLATTARIFVAPAMNVKMWEHSATRRNVAQLEKDGCVILGPAVGDQACGEVGPGRMLEPEDLVEGITAQLPQAPQRKSLAGIKVLVSAGPTREPIDPVRFLTNASSGRQGFAIAKAAQNAGADVTLVSGPVALPTPEDVHQIDVTTTSEMQKAVMSVAPNVDIFFAVAAVSDYSPANRATQKIKKQSNGARHLELHETPDIVSAVASLPNAPYTVGFAAETEHVLRHAKEKRLRKRLDAIVVNDVSRSDIGFDSEENQVTYIVDDDEIPIAQASKDEIAEKVVSLAAKSLRAQAASA